VELSEGTRRIFGQHWRLIVVFVAAGLALGLLVHSGATKSYTASARLTLDTQDPKSQSESTAIADTADAMATSPALVGQALADAHVRGRDAAKVASGHVSTRSLGTSGVLQLSVRDSDSHVAAAVANALAARVIRTRLGVTRGTTDQIVTTLGQRIGRINVQIAALDAKISSLNVQAATTADPVTANGIRSRRDDASRARDALAEQRSAFETERTGVVSADAQLPKPTIISSASPPSHPDSSGATAEVVLGLLLGAILGVGLAALLESVRPTVVGGEALATKFDTPLLGTLTEAPDGSPDLADMVRIAERLRLAASAEHVRTICILSAGQGIDEARLSKELDVLASAPWDDEEELVGASVPSSPPNKHVRASRSARRSDRGPLVRIRPFESRSFAIGNGHGNGPGSPHRNGSGVVLVCPPVLKQEAFASVGHLLRINPGRLLGVIEYSSAQTRRDPLGLADWEDA
jgi:capsular polysaccharide biosynthesis protein